MGMDVCLRWRGRGLFTWDFFLWIYGENMVVVFIIFGKQRDQFGISSLRDYRRKRVIGCRRLEEWSPIWVNEKIPESVPIRIPPEIAPILAERVYIWQLLEPNNFLTGVAT
jgi:hypothetical protein